MTSRERVLAALSHREPDRVPIHDSPWGTTVARWHREGLPEGASPAEFFGYEFASVGGDNSPRFERRVIEETDDYVIATNNWGYTEKNWKDRASTPQLIDFAVKTRDDWAAMREHLVPDPARVDLEAARKTHRAARSKGLFFTYSAVPGYEATWRKTGPERLLMAMLTDPDWVIEMYDCDARLVIANCQALLDGGIDFDAAFLYDDLGYKNGLLFSPRLYREQLKPFHRQMTDFFHRNGLRTILHSCGNVTELVGDLIEAGWDCLQPLEVKAGMDLPALKCRWGDRLALMGGIDVRTMSADDPRAIEREIRTKFEAAMPGGGYIYHSDHSIPDAVSFQQYERVIELVKSCGAYG